MSWEALPGLAQAGSSTEVPSRRFMESPSAASSPPCRHSPAGKRGAELPSSSCSSGDGSAHGRAGWRQRKDLAGQHLIAWRKGEPSAHTQGHLGNAAPVITQEIPCAK